MKKKEDMIMKNHAKISKWKKKFYGKSYMKIIFNTKNKNSKKALNEIKEVKEIEVEQMKNISKK